MIVSKKEVNSLLPDRDEGINSPIRRAKIDQLQYALPKFVIQRELDVRNIVQKTEIWIYPNYPVGYTAVVGGNDNRVYIFEVDRGFGRLVDAVPCLGVRPNGSLIY